MATYTIKHWEYENVSHGRNNVVTEELITMRNEAKFTDLSFICRGTENEAIRKTINTHQALFSSVSNFFRELFNIAHDKQPYERVIITLDSVDLLTLEKLIECVYEGNTNVTNQQKDQLLKLCTSLQLNIQWQPFLEPSSSKLVAVEQDLEMSCWTEMENRALYPDRAVQCKSPLEPYITIYEDNYSELAINNDTSVFIPTISNEYSVPEEGIKGTDESQSSQSHHYQINPFVCDMCPYSTAKKSILNAHVKRVHSQIKKHQCYYCEYRSTRKSHVYNHIYSDHRGLENYQCDDILEEDIKKETSDFYPTTLNVYTEQQRTKTKSKELKSSKRINSEMKTFVCHMCTFAAAREKTLKAHVEAIHLKIRNHKCSYCTYRCFRKTDLNLHINSVHLKLTRYKCKDCDYATNRSSNLYTHQRRMHIPG